MGVNIHLIIGFGDTKFATASVKMTMPRYTTSKHEMCDIDIS